MENQHSTWLAYAVKDLQADAKGSGYVEDVLGGRKIRLHPTPQAGGARVETPGGEALPVAYLYWFLLNALLDRYALYEPRTQG